MWDNLLTGGQVVSLGDLPFSPIERLTWLKMSEIILTKSTLPPPPRIIFFIHNLFLTNILGNFLEMVRHIS